MINAVNRQEPKQTKRARLLDVGRKPYREVWDLQHALHEAVGRGEEPETWIFVEHEPVITLGRNAKDGNVLLPREMLAAKRVDVVEIERSSDDTNDLQLNLVWNETRCLDRAEYCVAVMRT